MLQTRNYRSIGKNNIFQSGCPCPPRRLLALQVAASARWTFRSLLDSIRIKPLKQQSQQSAISSNARRLVGKQDASLALPPTFQRLSPALVVLLDPKHDRLVYLLTINEAVTTDAIAEQLRSLLQAAAAPYVHLMGVPDGLRAGLVREFPGGQPIITNVPLPAELATAIQQQLQQQERLRSCSDYREPHSNPGPGKPGLAQEVQVAGLGQWARGGVLELLFGSAEQQHAGQAEGPTVTGGKVEALQGGDFYDKDLPDEVMSRQKAMMRLMAWRKGTSMHVVRRRSERTPYKYDWLIQGFNTIDHLSVVVATPNLILIRNNVGANLGIDVLYQPESQDSDNGQGGGGTQTVELQVEGQEALPEGLMQVLKAVGILDSNSEKEGDNNGGEGEEEEDLAAILSMLAEDSDDDEDKDDNTKSAGYKEEEQEEGIADGLTFRALVTGGSRGQFREVLPGVFVRVVDAGVPRTGSDDNDLESGGNADDEDGELDWDTANTIDMQLSPGPMGWTASVRVGHDVSDTIARRKALLESLSADAEYIRNMQRLEALWSKTTQDNSLWQGQKDQEPGIQAAGEECTSSGRVDMDNDEVGNVQGLEADWQQAERRAADSLWAHPALPPGSGVGAAAAAGAVPTDHLMRPPRRPGTSASVSKVSASAAAADAAGDGVGEGPGMGRTVGKEEEISASALAAAETESLPHSTQNTGFPQREAPFIPSSPLPAASLDVDGFVASTRMRRGAEDEAPGDSNCTSTAGNPVASDTGKDGEESSGEGTEAGGGHVRNLGPSRMVRRPRGRMRLSRRLPSVSGSGVETITAANAEASAALPSSTAPSAPLSTPKEAVAGQGPAASAGAGGSSNADDVVAIPAYRNIRHNGASAGTAASAAPGTGSVADIDPGNGTNTVSRTPWTGRTGPALTPQSSGSGTTGLPPEASDYAALDLEQLAHFVLGRQASPEEVQDLARAMAQSAEVEEAFGGIAGRQLRPLHQQDGEQQQHGPLGLGPQPRKHPWRRPGTQAPSLKEALSAVSRSRRSVVTPRRRRLRIPEQVLQLAAARWPHGSQTLPGQPDATGPVGLDPDMPAESSEGRKLLSGLMLRRLGQRRAAESSVSALAASAGVDKRRGLQQDAVNQEEIPTVMLNAYRAAPPLERHAAEALVDFLHGRRHPGQHHAEGLRYSERAKHCDTGGFRSRTGLHGLVRGRDAVVVLPQSLLEATVGAWQEQEQRLMHEDYRVGSGHA